MKRFSKRLAAAFLTTIMLGAPGNARAARPAPENCVRDNAITDSVKSFLPLYNGFEEMEKATISGQPVARLLRGKSSQVQSCIVPDGTFPNRLTTGYYFQDDTKIKVYSDLDMKAFIHENFHAAQDINGGFDIFRLQDRDIVMGNLVLEASAFGYSFMYFQESGQAHGFNKTMYGYDRLQVFDAAYADAMKKFQDADPQTRKEKALEAGGRAVVRSLLKGENSNWSGTYMPQAARNMEFRRGTFRFGAEGYEQKRDELYSKLGLVSANINIVPEELLGPDADQYIDAYLKKAGYKPPTASIKPVKNGSAPHGKPSF